ncbi:MAG: hypothetical protein H0X63_07450 [Flavobacteriales bacterium]|nr:hypothetical protein [Flavobacteriales bacterium]
MILQKIAKRTLLILGFVAISITYSCKDNKTTDTTETDAVETTQNQTNTPANGNVALNPAHGEPGHRCEIPVGAPLNDQATTPEIKATKGSPVLMNQNSTAPANTNSSTAQLNPAHGQPGHRCEIPVGAPLNN